MAHRGRPVTLIPGPDPVSAACASIHGVLTTILSNGRTWAVCIYGGTENKCKTY